MKKQLEINIKDNLQEYLPSIFLLLNNENIKWDKIAMKYQDELYSRLSKSKIAKEGNDITSYEVCLFDVITRVVMGDFSFYNLLKFVDDIFRNLAKKTTEAEKKFLKDTMYNVLINTDKNYLNFIGEFAALNNMKNEEWELLSTEQPLTDNKKSIKADFEIRKNSITLLVEIVNIHLPDVTTLNDNKIEQLITQKITKKLSAKQNNCSKPFYLIPVLWGEYEALKLIDSYYLRNKIAFKNTMPPLAWASYLHKNGKLAKNMFGTIDKLILSAE